MTTNLSKPTNAIQNLIKSTTQVHKHIQGHKSSQRKTLTTPKPQFQDDFTSDAYHRAQFPRRAPSLMASSTRKSTLASARGQESREKKGLQTYDEDPSSGKGSQKLKTKDGEILKASRSDASEDILSTVMPQGSLICWHI